MATTNANIPLSPWQTTSAADDMDEHEYGDDLLNQGKALPDQVLAARLASVPALIEYLNQDWPRPVNSPYVRAYSAVVHIIVTAAAIGSTNISDLSRASGLPESFVLTVVGFLRSTQWSQFRIGEEIADPTKYAVLTSRLCEFMHSIADLELNFLDALRLFGSYM